MWRLFNRNESNKSKCIHLPDIPIRTHSALNKPFVFCHAAQDCPLRKLSQQSSAAEGDLNENIFSEYLIKPQNPTGDRSHSWKGDEPKHEWRNNRWMIVFTFLDRLKTLDLGLLCSMVDTALQNVMDLAVNISL